MTDGDAQTPAASTPTDALTRSYGVAFHDVWEAALAVLPSLRGWSVVTSDPRRGTIEATTANPLGRSPLAAWLKLWLDDMGQTRLEIQFEEPRHPLLRPAVAGRGRRYLRRVDRALGMRGRR